MVRKEINFGRISLIICVFSVFVSGIVNDDANNPFVPTENISFSQQDENRNNLNEVISDVEDLLSEQSFESTVDNSGVGQPFIAEAASQNVGALNDVTSGTPVLVPLPETATLELKVEIENLSATIAASHLESHENTTKEESETLTNKDTPEDKTLELDEPKNETDIRNITSETPEEIPSFSEWAQKRLEEAEKNEEVLNESIQHHPTSNGRSGLGVKLGWKNYASPDCGAKVVAANPEAVSPSSVISPSREEYKLNVCTNRIWFIVELCEAIQAKKIDIANFELFSSTPKDFTVSVGDRFPTREWTTVGQFVAKDERDVQSFDLNPYLFGRYIKVEIKSHHGSQHYCPISLFRVYGTSEMEVLQKEELSHSDEDDDEDDDESTSTYTDDLAKNMLNSATNAVYSMIKKAAEVLGTKINDTEETVNKSVKLEYSPLINSCSTPTHKIICANCSDLLFGQIYELLSCKSLQIHKLISVPFIQRSLVNSNICQAFGLGMYDLSNHSRFNRSSQSVESFFSHKVLGAMCNVLAISENRANLNNSQQFSNVTRYLNATARTGDSFEESKVNLEIEESINEGIPVINMDSMPTDELRLDSPNKYDLPKATCSTDPAYTSQIKPTKTVTLDSLVESSKILVDNETEELPGPAIRTETPNVVNVDAEEKTATSVEAANESQNVTDAPKQADRVTEPSENIDAMDNFMTEMHSENNPSTAPSISSSNNPVDRQKESVFLRLSNRIKALERNVSLSSQYLEELSRRYKKQVEEMQKLLEKTMQAVAEEHRKMDERNKQLEERLDQMMSIVGKWPSFIFWFFFSLAIVSGMMWLCGGERYKHETVEQTENIQRRKSIDVVPTTQKKPKTRRPSDQALKIVRSSLLSQERKLSREKRKKKRSCREFELSNSITGTENNTSRSGETISPKLAPKNYSSRLTPDRVHDYQNAELSSSPNSSIDWVDESRRLFESFPLDESEHSSLEPFSTIMEQDVPQYAVTAVHRRAHRISSQINMPNVNGDHRITDIPRKSGSLDESQKIKRNFMRRASLNSTSDDSSSRKKEKRSIKSVLKNVFS